MLHNRLKILSPKSNSSVELSSSNISVGRNLRISLVIVILVVSTTTAIIFAYITSIHDIRNLEKKADEILNNLVESVELPIWNFDREALDKIANAYSMSELIYELIISDELLEYKYIELKKDGKYKELLFKTKEVFYNNEKIGRVQIGLTKSFSKARLTSLFYSYLITTLVLAIILIIVTDYLLKIFLKRPFENLINGMLKMSKGHYDYDMSTAPKEKEFTAIAKIFKYMAEQISEREQNLSRAKNYISDIFNSIDSIIVGVDCNMKITHWNKAAHEFTTLYLEEVKQKNFFEILPQFKDIQEILWNALAFNVPSKEHHISLNSNNHARYFSVSIQPLSFEGDNGAVVRIDDISGRVKLEEMVIQTEKMLSVGGLAAGTAHEINNPLAGILQNVQVIQNRLFNEELPANINAADECGVSMPHLIQYLEKRRIAEMFKAVKDAGQRAARIVENMLSFSRQSCSGFFENDLPTIVNDTLELAANDYDLKKKYDFRNIKIVREFEDNLKAVPCDSGKIQQVILNILQNGAQAMSNNDRKTKPPCFIIRIRERKLNNKIIETDTNYCLGNYTAIEESGEIELEIEDNGHGMDEDIRKRVFEPFFTTKPVGVGTGLGLSVSYFIITENHKGSLSVTSSLGKGSVFTIRLPLKHIT